MRVNRQLHEGVWIAVFRDGALRFISTRDDADADPTGARRIRVRTADGSHHSPAATGEQVYAQRRQQLPELTRQIVVLVASRADHAHGFVGESRRYRGHFLMCMRSSAKRRAVASFLASSFAQKCMKKSRGCSSSMWLCTAVTAIPPVRRARITGLTSEAIRTKSPVIAARPFPVGWKLIAVARPIDAGISIPCSVIFSARGTAN